MGEPPSPRAMLGDGSSVTRIPRLPPPPSPPALGADPRQETFTRVVSNLQPVAAKADMHLAAVNTSTGYYAAAVDIGALKHALECGLKDFTLTQVQERWSDDVCAWMHTVVRTWVQRCKRRKLTCEDRGVHVLLETQDDHGYYRYEFDVLPGK